jgi:glycosyltransferase involved in cell wall biosynthesis
MTAPPLISAVVPSLNQGVFIARAIRSLLGQLDPRLEILVIDGGSTDRTLAELEPFRPHLECLVSEPDQGHADALRKGFSRARGELLLWLNADDILLPGSLAALRAALGERPDATFAHGARVFIDEQDRVCGFRTLPWRSPYALSRWPWMHQETVLMRRCDVDAVGGIDATLAFAVDYDLFVRLLGRGPAVWVDRPLGAFRVHPGSKSVREFVTVGRPERDRIARRHGVSPRWFEWPVGMALSTWIRLASGVRARRADVPRQGEDLIHWMTKGGTVGTPPGL